MLEATKTYSIVMFSSAKLPDGGPFSHYAAPYGWDGVRTTEQYTGGRAYFAFHDQGSDVLTWNASADDHDHFFQTFMSPIPEPNVSALLAVGLAVLVITTRKANHRKRP